MTGDTMKTQANKLFMFREMSDSITVEIAQQPHTTRSPIAVSMFMFTSDNTNNTIKMIVKKASDNPNNITLMYEGMMNNENYSHTSNEMSSHQLPGVITSLVNDVMNIQ